MTSLNWSDPPSQTAKIVAKAGYPFFIVSAFATAVSTSLGVDKTQAGTSILGYL